MLVLAITLTQPLSSDDVEVNDDTVQFGNGCISTEEIASFNGGDVGQELTVSSNVSVMVCIIYAKFNNGFVLEP